MDNTRRPSIYETLRQLDKAHEQLKAYADELQRHEAFIAQRWRVLDELLDPETKERLREQLDEILGATHW